MQYGILIYETEEEFAARSNGNAPAYWAGWTAFSQGLVAAGALAGGNCLQGPTTATTIRVRDGQRHVQDGPFADTKEQLGGLFVIEAPDLDAAIKLVEKVPSVFHGSVEIRPILPMS